MYNDYRLMVDVASIVENFADLKITVQFSEGTPNIAAREDITITDVAPIIRSVSGMKKTWSSVDGVGWSGQNKRPVYNFRSEERVT